ncbi:ROK family glucokinase [Ruminococcus sp. OA3]|uniref:ROK family glucokinase n=1 Tax=Ruminococcus sp. OA3 TaxID=2914164 RepID=UPI0023DD491F|nr:ROK family glucokinase [Ruminococcus sp. OA3]
MGEYCFGIDVGGTTIKLGCFMTDGTLLEKWEVPTRLEEQGKYILSDAAGEVKRVIRERGLENGQVCGVGLAVPGPVNDEGEASQAVNLHWGYKHLVRELGDMLNLPVKAANDANAAALGELWQGAGKGCRNMIMVTLGTGVGGGIIVNGKIVAGEHGAAGEIGHACVEPSETAVCNCGNHGCLEQMASATGIVRLAKMELAGCDEESLLRAQEVTAKNVFDAYKQRDALAGRVVEKFAQYLGNALSIYACVVDPGRIVIGGGVSKAGEVLIGPIRKYYERDAFPACKDTPIVLAELGNDAGIYGSAKLVLP